MYLAPPVLMWNLTPLPSMAARMLSPETLGAAEPGMMSVLYGVLVVRDDVCLCVCNKLDRFSREQIKMFDIVWT